MRLQSTFVGICTINVPGFRPLLGLKSGDRRNALSTSSARRSDNPSSPTCQNSTSVDLERTGLFRPSGGNQEDTDQDKKTRTSASFRLSFSTPLPWLTYIASRKKCRKPTAIASKTVVIMAILAAGQGIGARPNAIRTAANTKNPAQDP